MLLEVRNLMIQTKSTKQTLVKESSFSLAGSGALGIIGESGSGKTMTSKALMGLLNPRVFSLTGSVKFSGQELIGLKEQERRKLRGSQMAMIMQNPMTAFAPMIKIGKQVTDTLLVHGATSREACYKKAVQALQAINLPEAQRLMDSWPHELSGGMLQRIMIALTMLLEPKIIIADEATTAVDAASEKLILEEFKRIRRAGTAMIVVTHDFGVAAALCDDVLVMKDGEIVERGKVQRVFQSPGHPYTRELVAASILWEGTHAEG